MLVMFGCANGTTPGAADDGPHRDATPGDGTEAGDAGPDAMPSSGAFGVPFPASISCAPVGDVCNAAPVDGVFSTYRKDAFLPSAQYPEANLPDPTTGGRVHVVTRSAVTGQVTKVRIRNQDAPALVSSGYLDWFHVWPVQVTAGKPVWVTFHGRASELDALAGVELEIQTSGGVAAAATFPLARPVVPLTYVTTTPARDAYLVHAKNTDTAPHTLARLVVDGRDVTAMACIPSKTLAPGEVAMWRVPRCEAAALGDAWTVVADWADALPSTAGGRILAPHFPIHTWPVERDCPFPGGKPQAATQHVQHGFDTFFLRSAYNEDGCAVTGAQIIASAPNANIFVMPDEFMTLPASLGADQKVLARLLADEADANNDDAHLGALAATSQASWSSNPTMATYIGGSRGRKVGRFAGAADLQGMDFYVGACAPHVTDALSNPPLRASFDYLRITRDNHMPLPTWLYTQGLHAGWNKNVLGLPIIRQPSPAESRIQAFSVVAAGGKGLMYFQTDFGLATGAASETWAAIGNHNRDIRAVRQWLREGDITGGASASVGDVITEAIRAPGALVVVAVNTRNNGGVDDPTCVIPTNDPHWAIAATAPDLQITLPRDLAVGDAFEIRNGTVLELPPGATYAGRVVTLPGIAMDADLPTRMFVFATSPTARADVEASF